MQNLQNDIAKQREITISFDFEQKDTKFIINAKSEDVLYVGQMEQNPFCTFEDVAKALQSNQYILTTKNSDVLKIKVGGVFSVNFVSKQKQTLDELKKTIKQLIVRVENQETQNRNLKAIVKNHQTTIQQLKADQLTLREEINKMKADQLTQRVEINKINQKQLNQQEKLTIHAKQIHQISEKDKIEKQNTTKIQTDILKKLSELKTSDSKQIAQISSLQLALSQLTLAKFIDFEKLFFTSSKVIVSSQQKQFIKGFFTNKNITNAELLYRASEHGFDVKKFHQKCDNIPNTLLVCHTEYDKKFGGFTPLTWTSPVENQHKADDKKETFVFSLSHNHKFTLQNTTYAICCKDSYGPFFGYSGGSADIWIHNNADKNNNSGTCPNNCFYNSNYTKNSKESFQMFSGNPNSTYYFQVKEWQVWGLKFQ